MKSMVEKTIKDLKKLHHKNDKRVKKLEHILFKEFCPKQYLNSCEPAYCSLRITNSCKYFKVLRKILSPTDNS